MKQKIVFFYSDSANYESNDPVFYKNVGELPEVQYVLDNYEVIKQEVSDYVSGKVDIDIFHSNPSPPAMNQPGIWKNIYFKNYMVKYALGKKCFPRTFQIFSDKPEFTLAGITTLAPGGKLLSHCGETNALIRCHVGLKVPGTLPDLGLKVNGQSVCWEEGKVFAFNDAYQHEVWNDTSEPRYVLAFDLIRPEFSRYRTAVCAYCLGIGAMRFILEKLGVYQQTPIWLRALVTKPFALTLWFYLVLASLPQFARRHCREFPWVGRWRSQRDQEENPSREIRFPESGHRPVEDLDQRPPC